MKNTLGRLVVSGAVLLVASTSLLAAASGKINYQGRLLDPCGRRHNGQITVSFSIFNAAAGGLRLWIETHTDIAVVDGVYAIALGSKTPIPASVFAQDNTYLEVVINGETLRPRQPITSAAQALVARTVMGPEIYVNQANGNVGVGTQAPAEKLDVAGTVRATGFKMPTGAAANRVLTSDAGGVARWAPAPGITTEADPIHAAWVVNTYRPATGAIWAAINSKADKATYEAATNALWAAINGKLSLSGGVMTGPLTNTFGFVGDGYGLTNLNTAALGLTNFVLKTGDTMSGALSVGGALTAQGAVTVNGKTVYTPPAVLALTNGAVLNPAVLTYVRVVGMAPKTLLGNPQIAAGTPGQVLVVQGTDPLNTVQLVDGNGLSLCSGVSFTMGTNAIIQLVYNGGNWVELHRAAK